MRHSTLTLLATMAVAATGAHAQTFPVKPLNIVVPIGPGGGYDFTGRLLGEGLSKELGQPVIVENRSGAAGQIGTAHVARSAPDGYTVLVAIGAAHALSLYAYKTLPYHPVNDFTPITVIADTILGV